VELAHRDAHYKIKLHKEVHKKKCLKELRRNEFIIVTRLLLSLSRTLNWFRIFQQKDSRTLTLKRGRKIRSPNKELPEISKQREKNSHSQVKIKIKSIMSSPQCYQVPLNLSVTWFKILSKIQLQERDLPTARVEQLGLCFLKVVLFQIKETSKLHKCSSIHPRIPQWVKLITKSKFTWLCFHKPT